MAGNPIANLLGKVDANNALVVTLSGGTASATVFLAGDGSASAPSYSFASATNYGMYVAVGDSVRFSIAGVLGMSVNQTGFVLGASQDVSLSCGAPNRLDLGAGDDFRIVSGGLGVGVTPSAGAGAIQASGLITVAGAITSFNGTAIPAGGTEGSGFKFSSTSNFGVFFGSGAPTLSAAQGSLYLRSDGSSTSTRAYINNSAGSGTTWTAITTAA